MSPITTLERTLQLRIHEQGTTNPTDGTVEFTLEHSRFVDAPSFGGQRVIPDEGRTESIAYPVRVLDVNGEFTDFISDNGQLVALGRIAELRISTDGGAFETVDMRRISALRGGSDSWYDIECSDERWIERTTELFTLSPHWQLHPAGQAIAWLDKPATPLHTYRVRVDSTDYISLFASVNALGAPRTANLETGLVDTLISDLLDVPTVQGGFLALRFSDGANDRTVVGFDIDMQGGTPNAVKLRNRGPLGPVVSDQARFNYIVIYWPSHGLTDDQELDGRLYWPSGVRTSEATPYLIGGLDGIRAPDLLEDIVEGDHGGGTQRFDSAVFAGLTGDVYPREWYEITKPQPRDEWVDQNIYRRFLLTALVDHLGRMAPKSLRPPTDIDPDTLYVFDASNVVDKVTWENPGLGAITRVELNCRIPLSFGDQIVDRPFADDHDTAGVLGIRPLTIDTDAILRFSDASRLFAAIKQDIFERFGDGPQQGGFGAHVRDDSPTPGDLAILDHDQLNGPNPADGTRSGKRIVQLLERVRVHEATRTFYRYAYLDLGPNNQPLATPSVSIVQGTDTHHEVDITVSNVPAGATANVEIAHGATPADEDWFVAATQVGNETVTIGERPSGTQINTRVQAVARSRVRSARSAVDSVTTEELDAPTGLDAQIIVDTTDVRCVITGPTETDYEVVFIAETVTGSVHVQTRVLPPGTTQYTFRAMPAVTNMRFRMYYRDPWGGRSPEVSDTNVVDTSGIAPPLYALWLQARYVQPDFVITDVPAIAAVRVHVAPEDRSFDVVIERAPDDGGSPDEANRVKIAQIASSILVDRTPRRITDPLFHVVHEDLRPVDGSTWWYRAYHTKKGWQAQINRETEWVPITLDDVPDVSPVEYRAYRVHVPFQAFESEPGLEIDKTNGYLRSAVAGGAPSGRGLAAVPLPQGATAIKHTVFRSFSASGVSSSLSIEILESVDGTESGLIILSNSLNDGVWHSAGTPDDFPIVPRHTVLDPDGSLRLRANFTTDADIDEVRIMWVDLWVIALAT